MNLFDVLKQLSFKTWKKLLKLQKGSRDFRSNFLQMCDNIFANLFVFQQQNEIFKAKANSNCSTLTPNESIGALPLSFGF